jgi:hypothetical protein
MGKSTISLAIFNSYVSHNQRVATITSRLVFFSSAHFVHNRPRSKLLAHFYPQPWRAQSGQMWPEWDTHGVPEILGKTSWTCPGNHYFIDIYWDNSWRFGKQLGDFWWIFMEFHDFFCKTAQDCSMQPGKTFLDVPRWEFFRPPRGAGVCHSFDCSFWDSSRTIKAT